MVVKFSVYLNRLVFVMVSLGRLCFVTVEFPGYFHLYLSVNITKQMFRKNYKQFLFDFKKINDVTQERPQSQSTAFLR